MKIIQQQKHQYQHLPPNNQPQLQPNQRVQQQGIVKRVHDYNIFLDKRLGKGQFGEVFMCKNMKDNQFAAVKIISLQGYSTHALQNPNSQLAREIQVMKQLSHPNLVCLKEIQFSTNNLYIFIDYCDGGDLASYLKKKGGFLDETEALDFFKQIIAGYNELYRNQIIHRDLKPENILLHQGQLKICDFGFGRILDGDMEQPIKASKRCTPIYASCQMLKGEKYSSKTDVWSLGVMLYQMIYKNWPFIAQTEYDLIRNIEQIRGGKKLRLPSKPKIGNDIGDLIQLMLQYDEKDRISIPDIQKHPAVVVQENQQIPLAQEDNQDCNNEKDRLLKDSVLNNRVSVRNKFIHQNPNTYENKALVQKPESQAMIKKTNATQLGNQLDENKTNTNSDDSNKETKNQDTQKDFEQMQQMEIEKLIVNKYDKKLLFRRNRALYGNYTLQQLWDVKSDLNQPNYLIKGIIFCLGGYYYTQLQELYRVMLDVQKSADDFKNSGVQDRYYLKSDNIQFNKVTYASSAQFQKTKQIINKDYEDASNFFPKFQQVVKQELESQLSDNCPEILKQICAFIDKFKLDDQKESEIIQMTLKLSKYMFQQINLNNQSERSLRSLYALIMFSLLDKFQPFDDYKTFDFRKFYNEKLVSQSQDYFRNEIAYNISQEYNRY